MHFLIFTPLLTTTLNQVCYRGPAVYMRCGTRPGRPFQVGAVIKKGGWRVTAGGPPRLCLASTQALSHSTLFPTPAPIIFTKTATYCNIILYHCVNTCGMPSKNTPLTTYRYIGSIVLFQQVEGASIACWFFSYPPPCFPFPLVVCTALTLLPTKCTNTFVLPEYYRVYTNLKLRRS